MTSCFSRPKSGEVVAHIIFNKSGVQEKTLSYTLNIETTKATAVLVVSELLRWLQCNNKKKRTAIKKAEERKEEKKAQPQNKNPYSTTEKKKSKIEFHVREKNVTEATSAITILSRGITQNNTWVVAWSGGTNEDTLEKKKTEEESPLQVKRFQAAVR